MKISSMTGFAKKTGVINLEGKIFDFSFEIKSVNSKSLDVKSRSPMFLGDMNIDFKNIVAKQISRGSVNIFLDFSSNEKEQSFKVNEELFEEVLKKTRDIYEENKSFIEKSKASDLLLIKGVLEVEENKLSDEEIEIIRKELFTAFEVLCEDLSVSRKQEGSKICEVLLDNLKKIEEITTSIEKMGDSLSMKIREKLLSQVKEIISDNIQISEDRIAQEIIFYVAKADIREEIDRLKAHIQTAKDLLSSGKPVGRKLDFLCQELNREANTTCSKSIDLDLTNYGMELKALVEQFREQVQNIE